MGFWFYCTEKCCGARAYMLQADGERASLFGNPDFIDNQPDWVQVGSDASFSSGPTYGIRADGSLWIETTYTKSLKFFHAGPWKHCSLAYRGWGSVPGYPSVPPGGAAIKDDGTLWTWGGLYGDGTLPRWSITDVSSTYQDGKHYGNRVKISCGLSTSEPVSHAPLEHTGLSVSLHSFENNGQSATYIPSITNGNVYFVEVLSPGSGYSAPPDVVFSPSGASAFAVLDGGQVRSIHVSSGGGSYTEPPEVSVIASGGGAGSGCKAKAYIEGSVLVTVTDPGSGYTRTRGLHSYEFKAHCENPNIGKLIAPVLGSAGEGYLATVPPAIEIVGSGVGATATATVDASGSVTSVSVTNQGFGYDATTKVVFSPSGADAEAVIGEGGTIDSINVVYGGGSAYLRPAEPQITIDHAWLSAGDDGVIRARMKSDGSIESLYVADPGSGYEGLFGDDQAPLIFTPQIPGKGTGASGDARFVVAARYPTAGNPGTVAKAKLAKGTLASISIAEPIKISSPPPCSVNPGDGYYAAAWRISGEQQGRIVGATAQVVGYQPLWTLVEDTAGFVAQTDQFGNVLEQTIPTVTIDWDGVENASISISGITTANGFLQEDRRHVLGVTVSGFPEGTPGWSDPFDGNPPQISLSHGGQVTSGWPSEVALVAKIGDIEHQGTNQYEAGSYVVVGGYGRKVTSTVKTDSQPHDYLPPLFIKHQFTSNKTPFTGSEMRGIGECTFLGQVEENPGVNNTRILDRYAVSTPDNNLISYVREWSLHPSGGKFKNAAAGANEAVFVSGGGQPGAQFGSGGPFWVGFTKAGVVSGEFSYAGNCPGEWRPKSKPLHTTARVLNYETSQTEGNDNFGVNVVENVLEEIVDAAVSVTLEDIDGIACVTAMSVTSPGAGYTYEPTIKYGHDTTDEDRENIVGDVTYGLFADPLLPFVNARHNIIPVHQLVQVADQWDDVLCMGLWAAGIKGGELYVWGEGVPHYDSRAHVAYPAKIDTTGVPKPIERVLAAAGAGGITGYGSSPLTWLRLVAGGNVWAYNPGGDIGEQQANVSVEKVVGETFRAWAVSLAGAQPTELIQTKQKLNCGDLYVVTVDSGGTANKSENIGTVKYHYVNPADEPTLLSEQTENSDCGGALGYRIQTVRAYSLPQPQEKVDDITSSLFEGRAVDPVAVVVRSTDAPQALPADGADVTFNVYKAAQGDFIKARSWFRLGRKVDDVDYYSPDFAAVCGNSVRRALGWLTSGHAGPQCDGIVSLAESWTGFVKRLPPLFEFVSGAVGWKADGSVWATDSLEARVQNQIEITVQERGDGLEVPPRITLEQPPGVSTPSITFSAKVIAIGVEKQGSGYSIAPSVTIEPSIGGGAGAAAVAKIVGGIKALQIKAAGDKYDGPPLVSFSRPGIPASASLSMAGAVDSIVLCAGGSGYREPPAVTIEGGGGSGAYATCTVRGGVQRIDVDIKGSGYKHAPDVSVGGDCKAVARLKKTDDGLFEVFDVVVTEQGSGFSEPPAVAFSGGDPITPAQATAVLSAAVDTVSVTAGGSGYASPPVVSFGGTGRGAEAAAVLSLSAVSATIENGGRYWDSPPTVTVKSRPSVSQVTVDSKGSMYQSAPDVTLAAGSGKGASACCKIAGPLHSISVTDGGYGYDPAYPPYVSLGGGYSPVDGVPAAASAVVSKAGAVQSVSIDDPGVNYTSPPEVVIRYPEQATAYAVLAGDKVEEIRVTYPGAYYAATPAVIISGGGGDGAQAEAELKHGSVSKITVTNQGQGYSTAPSVLLYYNTAGRGARAQATIDGKVTEVIVSGRGLGYYIPPQPMFSGGLGTGAEATALTTSNGGGVSLMPQMDFSVGYIEVTSQGSGYQFSPTVTISPPPEGGEAAVAKARILGRVINITANEKCKGVVSGFGYALDGSTVATREEFHIHDDLTYTARSDRGVTDIVVTNSGDGYESQPTVSVTDSSGDGTGCTAHAVMRQTGDGVYEVARVVVDSPGSGYESPTVTFSGGAATATAILTGTVAFAQKPVVLEERNVGAIALTMLTASCAGVDHIGSPGSGSQLPALDANLPLKVWAGTQTNAAWSGDIVAAYLGKCVAQGAYPLTTAGTEAVYVENEIGTDASADVSFSGSASVSVSPGDGAEYLSRYLDEDPFIGFEMATSVTQSLAPPTAVASISGGKVSSVTLTSQGGWPRTPAAGFGPLPGVTPRVFFSGGGGTGASATISWISGQYVISLTSGGDGYTTAPDVYVLDETPFWEYVAIPMFKMQLFQQGQQPQISNDGATLQFVSISSPQIPLDTVSLESPSEFASAFPIYKDGEVRDVWIAIANNARFSLAWKQEYSEAPEITAEASTGNVPVVQAEIVHWLPPTTDYVFIRDEE